MLLLLGCIALLFSFPKANPPSIYQICSCQTLPVHRDKVVAFLRQNNPALSIQRATQIVEIYRQEAAIESINIWVALAQMIVETAFLRFTGQVKAEQNNFAGIGCVDNAARGASFTSIREGVRAHIQHLKAYASQKPLHRPCIDPRRRFVEDSPHFGKIKTVFDLSGTWAMDPEYGTKLAQMIQQLRR